MRIGCGARIEELALVKEYGFDYVELRGRALMAMSLREVEELRGQLEARGLPCLAINAYCPPEITIAGPRYDRARARRYAEELSLRAGLIGAKKIGIGSPCSRTLPEGYDRALARRQCGEFLADTAEVFAKEKVETGIEPLGYCFCNFINHLEEAYELAVSLDGYPVGITLDFYNMEQSGEADIELERFADRIIHAHISDDWGSPNLRSPLDAEKLALHAARVEKMMKAGYDDTLTLELDVPMDEAARESLRMMRAMVGGGAAPVPWGRDIKNQGKD